MKLKVSDKLRGTCVLTSIGIRLKQGMEFVVADEAMNNDDVQMAIERNLIHVVGPSDPPQKQSYSRANVQNVSPRALAIECLKRSLPPGQVVVMSEKEMADPKVELAIQMGLLKVLGPTDAPVRVTPAKPKVQAEAEPPVNPNIPAEMYAASGKAALLQTYPPLPPPVKTLPPAIPVQPATATGKPVPMSKSASVLVPPGSVPHTPETSNTVVARPQAAVPRLPGMAPTPAKSKTPPSGAEQNRRMPDASGPRNSKGVRRVGGGNDSEVAGDNGVAEPIDVS